MCGIAEEGALAFTEIAMLTGRYFHLLDYRHGPIVISGEKNDHRHAAQTRRGKAPGCDGAGT